MKPIIRVGDNVEVLDFRGSDDPPYWIADMDEYVGNVYRVEEISIEGYIVIGDFLFDEKWVRLVDEEQMQDNIANIVSIL